LPRSGNFGGKEKYLDGYIDLGFVSLEWIQTLSQSRGFTRAWDVVRQLPASRSANCAMFNAILRAWCQSFSQKVAQMSPPNSLVSFREVVEFFVDTQAVKPDSETMDWIFRGCEKSNDATLAWSMKELAKGLSIQISPVGYSSLLNCLGKCKQVSRAEKIFADLVKTRSSAIEPPLLAAMVSVYARNGLSLQAFTVYGELRKQDKNHGNRELYISLLRCCADLRNAVKASKILEELRSSGVRIDYALFGGLITAFSKSGEVEQALTLFLDAVSTGFRANETTLVTLIVACRTRPALASQVFNVLKEHHKPIPVKAANCLIDVFVKAGQEEYGDQVFASLLTSGGQPDRTTYETMIRKSAFPEAMRRFVEARERGLATTSTANALLSVFVKEPCADSVEGLVEDIERSGLKKDGRTHSLLISIYTRLNHVDQAMKQAEKLLLTEASLESLTAINALLPMVFLKGRRSDGFRLLEIMRERGLTFGATELSTLAASLKQEVNMETALEVTSYILNHTKIFTIDFCNVILDLYRTARKYQDAVLFFETTMQMKVKPNSMSFNIMIVVYGKMGKFDRIQSIFRDMSVAEVTPDAITYSCLIDAHGKAGRIQQALATLAEMQDVGVKLTDQYPYSSLIAACGKAGQIDQAVEVFELLRRDPSLNPNEQTYNSLIYALGMAGRPNEAFSMFEEMKNAGLKPDAVTYSSLSSICLRYKIAKSEVIDGLRTHAELGCDDQGVGQGRKLSRKARRMERLFDGK